MTLQFEFCPPLGAPRGGQKNFLRFAQILPPLDLFLYTPLEGNPKKATAALWDAQGGQEDYCPPMYILQLQFYHIVL